MPFVLIDYLLGINTGAPLYVQLKQNFPEIVSVNALYTHALVVIISPNFAQTVSRDARVLNSTWPGLCQGSDCRG
jgi:hypothetical protein